MADLTRVDRRDGPSRRVKDIGDGLYADVVGAVGDENVFDLTLTLDTSAYASGDVLSATAEIAGFFVSTTSSRIITSVRVLDEDDQAGDFDILFLDAGNSIGTANSAVSVTDANARAVVGQVAVSAADYKDLGGCQVAMIANIGQVVKANGSTSIWIATVSRSTKTYTAAGLRLKIGVL